MVTPVAITVRPRSRSKPVPDSRFPNWAVVYQSVFHGVDGLPDSASEAFCGLSPPDVPPGPNAVALTGVTSCAGVVAGDGRGLGEGGVLLGVGLGLGRVLAEAD
jgi:hypothetical protein